MFATVHFFKPLLYWYSYILTSSNNRVKTAVQSIEDSDVEKRTNFNLHRAKFTNYLTSLNFFVKQLNFRYLYSEIENSYFCLVCNTRNTHVFKKSNFNCTYRKTTSQVIKCQLVLHPKSLVREIGQNHEIGQEHFSCPKYID